MAEGIGTRCPSTTHQTGRNQHRRTIVVPHAWPDSPPACYRTARGITSCLVQLGAAYETGAIPVKGIGPHYRGINSAFVQLRQPNLRPLKEDRSPPICEHRKYCG